MSEKTMAEKKPLLKKVKSKKDVVLRVSMILFAAAYPLTYISAKSGFLPLMTLAAGIVLLGSLLAAVL